MTPTHDGHAPSAGAAAALLPAAVLLAYLVAAGRQARVHRRRWSHWRTASFAAGSLLLIAAVAGPVAGSDDDFRVHMLQHLLIGMLAPLGLVLGAPLTLTLRTLSPRSARAVVRVLRSRPAHILAHPLTALALAVGGLYALYLTPFFRAATASPPLHALIHAHFLTAGCLFTWAIAGPDPGPRRPSVPLRLTVLGVAVAAHAALSQLMYAGLLVGVPAPPDQVRDAATIMYYGGDLAEILLALALLATWRPRRPPRAGRTPPSWRPQRRDADAGSYAG